jgi:LCP family protein required for cell wall assembly
MKSKSAGVAASLSFLFPGLGHAYLGRRRAALVFALPLVISLLAIGLELLVGIDRVLAYVITPSGSMNVLVLIVLTGLWQLIAIVDTVLIVRRRSGIRVPAMTLTGVLLAVVLVSHAAGAYLAYSVYDASTRIFVGDGPDDPAPSADPGGIADVSPSPSDDYVATPLATPPTASSRINILLTGIDSAAGRAHSLTDTLLVISVNPVDNSVVMLSMPRDVSNFPMYNGKTYTGKINSLMTWARNHPQDYPDGPFPTLIRELGYLIGIPIHYYAAIDLAGFTRMINVVGGVTVDNPRAINDPKYDWLDGSSPGFYLKAGTVSLDGRTALAYVRSRQGLGDSDFTRAARQQQLLVALRAKLSTPAMIPKLPDILRVAGDTVRTNLPTDRLEEFIALGRTVDTSSIKRHVLGPPYALHPPNSTTGGIYTLQLQMDRIAKLSVELFGTDSRYAGG